MTINLPEDVTPVNPTATTDGIQLPFTAPLFWWNNGSKQLKQVGGVSYFGGWQGSNDLVETAMAEYGALPDGFTVEERTGNDGEYVVYACRALTVVPIKTRKRWKDNRSHSQTLCLMAKKENNERLVWGPVVLSAKGYATDRLSKAIQSWVMHTREVREKIAPNVPAWYFWSALGTFGEHSEEMVGGGKQSPITPIKAYLPEITEKLMENLYVGSETARHISELEKKSQEWANDEKWLTGTEKLVTAPVATHEPDWDHDLQDENPF
jgi:hypothetical protein